jgi:hypothetical protein
VLTYIPWNLQRRFVEGVQVPLGLLAGVGVAEGLFPQPSGHRLSRPRWLAMASLVALASVSNLYLTIGYTVTAASRDSRLFWPAEVMAGVDWLGKYTEPDDTVLSSFEVGNLIPGRIGHRVVLGHWIETIDHEKKQAAVARFYRENTSQQERFTLLKQYNVRYVFQSRYERGIGLFDPSSAGYLTRVYSDAGVDVYEVDLR